MEEQIQELKELMKDVIEDKSSDSFSTYSCNVIPLSNIAPPI